jgi:hypothetical protein
MRAAAPTAKEPTDCEEKRDRVNDQANDDQKELDPNARLEKRTTELQTTLPNEQRTHSVKTRRF